MAISRFDRCIFSHAIITDSLIPQCNAEIAMPRLGRLAITEYIQPLLITNHHKP